MYPLSWAFDLNMAPCLVPVHMLQREIMATTMLSLLGASDQQAIATLAKQLLDHDADTFAHSLRVGLYAAALGDDLSLDRQALFQSGLMHDIGKLRVSTQTLNHPGRLTDEQVEEIKQHPSLGVQILAAHGLNADHVYVSALYHHCSYDGKSGYPLPSNREIPLIARAISVCDAFDAMTSKRTYNQPKSTHDALAELCSGTLYDPAVVHRFCSLFE